MIKTIRVMLLPNKKQETKLFQYANTSRFAYNWALGREQENHKENKKFITDGDLRKELTQLKKTEEYAWLNTVSNNVTKQAVKDACDAYQKFFKGLADFPKFKSRKHSEPSFYQDNVKIKFTSTHVKGSVPIEFVSLGRWWGNDPIQRSQTEIDIMGEQDSESALFAECRWRNENVDLDVLETLIGRSKLFRYTKVHYYLFSKSGFTRGCMEKAEEMGNVTLVSYENILSSMK